MFLMYVDESGDFGDSPNSPTDAVALCGVVVHVSRWRSCVGKIAEFRRSIMSKYGLHFMDEIHSAHLINKPGRWVAIKRHNRLAIVRSFADLLATMGDLRIISVFVEKKGKTTKEAFAAGWGTLIQRFENTLLHYNFPNSRMAGASGCYGMLIPDHSHDEQIRLFLRKMRHANVVPSKVGMPAGARDMPLSRIIEDPYFRDSRDSYMVQAADLAAFLLYQHERPSTYMKEKSGHNYFNKLDPILCKVASSTDMLGIVRR